MKNLRIVGFMLFALFFTGVAFAQAPIDPYLYGDFPPEEADQHLEDFLPVYFNGQGFLEPEIKHEIGQLAKSRLARKGKYSYRDYFNAAVIYATPIGDVRHYRELTDTDAAKAIDYATRAIEGSPRLMESPRMPYMYLVRAETYHRQGVPFREDGIAPVLDRDMALKAMKDYEAVLVLNPRMAPKERMCSLAQALKDSVWEELYCQGAINPIIEILLQRQKAAPGKSLPIKSLPIKKLPLIEPDAEPDTPSPDPEFVPLATRDLFRGVPKRAN